jgi:hypothetical protein
VITQLHETGEHPRLEAMREEVPAGVLDMLRVPGLRRERVQKLYKELGLTSVADLEDAARSGRLAATKGFGPAFQAKVLQGLAMQSGPQGRHLHRAAAALRFAADAPGSLNTNGRSYRKASGQLLKCPGRRQARVRAESGWSFSSDAPEHRSRKRSGMVGVADRPVAPI